MQPPLRLTFGGSLLCNKHRRRRAGLQTPSSWRLLYAPPVRVPSTAPLFFIIFPIINFKSINKHMKPASLTHTAVVQVLPFCNTTLSIRYATSIIRRLLRTSDKQQKTFLIH